MEKVLIKDKKYPKRLKEIKSPPEKLYYLGEWDSKLFEKCLSVVGSRKMTRYGRKVTRKLAGEAAMAGITIVSGFMYGIDITAQKTALEVGGKTIAVMPCGADVVHPAYHKRAYDQILDGGGLILSQFEPGFPSKKWTYPKRNEVVVGLSQATLVIEAAPNSGSLISARLAKKFKRKLFAVPGSIISPVSEGTNNLIKKGVSPVVEAKDILEFFSVSSEKENRFSRDTHKKGMGLAGRILKVLERDSMSFDEITKELKVSSSKLGTTLSIMELNGSVEKEGNRYFIKDAY